MTVAKVQLWGRDIGAVSWNADREVAYFEYEPAFRKSGIEVSPVAMPLSDEIYGFTGLAKESFYGLPGMLADSLPDKYGKALIDAWLASQGRAVLNPVERLCYVGSRGMGALEFAPSIRPKEQGSQPVDVAALVELASEILAAKGDLAVSFADHEKAAALPEILRVGTSAGGARAKAVIAWNEKTGEVRSGQVDVNKGFFHWLLKFDGVDENKDRELNDPKGYGLIEYAYYLMARAAGITMNECRIMEENGRHHFMTKRFDRDEAGKKIHMQSLGALRHFDFNLAGAYGYEQAFETIRMLGLNMDAIEEQFRRMAFNIIARNQDDHVKNIAFMMNKAGDWSLSPAFDVTYAFNPSGAWTGQHQMSLQGKRDDFTRDDFVKCGSLISMARGRASAILDEVQEAVNMWEKFANQAEVTKDIIQKISIAHRKV